MADYIEIREALAAALEPIAGLQESAYMLANPTLPCAEVVPAPIEYDETFARGTDVHRFIVQVLVGTAVDKGAQKRLDRHLAGSGPDSVKAAIEADRSLGRVVQDCYVRRCSGYRNFGRPGGQVVLGAEWEVEIRAEGEA